MKEGCDASLSVVQMGYAMVECELKWSMTIKRDHTHPRRGGDQVVCLNDMQPAPVYPWLNSGGDLNERK